MSRPGRALLRLLALSAIAGAASSACARSERASAPGCPSAEGAPIERPTMAFLSIARALHHEADIAESRGDVRGAIRALERLVAAPAPSAVEVDEVLADARARLAELRLKQGDFEGAGRDVQAGLSAAGGATYFRGHLLEVAGIVEEARAGALADAGRSREAERARSKAMALLEDAVKVQEQVIAGVLADGGRDE